MQEIHEGICGTNLVQLNSKKKKSFLILQKKIKRRLEMKNRVVSHDSETIWHGLQKPTVTTGKRLSNSRRRRLTIAKNEAEISMGIKAVAKLERIRTVLEKETGRVTSLSCWAEAAGADEKVLLQQLHFGLYCRDELLRIKTPEETVMRQHMKKDINDLLLGLDSRERQVLILRYGLKNCHPKSLEEIGRHFRVSKEWIRKIEKKALEKLRDKETNRNLSHYLKL
ncbi:hypothetical protein UlMin_034825 [Ulmus minor]